MPENTDKTTQPDAPTNKALVDAFASAFRPLQESNAAAVAANQALVETVTAALQPMRDGDTSAAHEGLVESITSALQPLRDGRVAAVTAEDVRRAGEQAVFLRQHEVRDRLRDESGTVEVIAMVGFMIHDDVLLENPREVKPGDRLTIARYDLDKAYAGKVRLVELPPTPGGPAVNNGVTIT